MIAFAESPAGNCTVKALAVVVLSDPKSSTATAGLPAEVLYISAPLAVMVALAHVESTKSKNAVVPVDVGLAEIVSVFPPAA